MTTGTARRTSAIDYKWIVAIVFVCGMFIDILDTTIVNVALPDLGREFHATTASIEWIVLGYLLSLALWPGVGLVRRSLRHPSGLPLCVGRLHRVLGAVWPGPQPRGTRRLPGPA